MSREPILAAKHVVGGAFAIAVAAVGAGVVWRMGSMSASGSAPAASPVAGASIVRLLEEVQSFGEEEGADAGVIGTVGDALLDRRGRVYVLDVSNQRVAVFGLDGTLAASYGRKGRGPGELFHAVAIAMDAHGELFVLDGGNRRIEVFDPRSGASVRSLALDFTGEDLCFAGDDLLLLGYYRGHTVHQLSPSDGAVLRSFGADPAAEDPLLRTYRTAGNLQCGAGHVAYLPALRSEVVRYSLPDGAANAVIPIPGYSEVRVQSLPDGGVRFEADEAGHDVGGSIVALDDRRSLVQVGKLQDGATTRHVFRQVRSFVLDWEAGIMQPVAELPRMVSAQGDMLVASATEPYPRVTLFRFDLSGGTYARKP